MVPVLPITWVDDTAPYTVVGDVQWSDISASIQLRIDTDSDSDVRVAFLAVRVRDCCQPSGVYLALNANTHRFGIFPSLPSAASFNASLALASGAYSPTADGWHAVALTVVGDIATASIDGAIVAAGVGVQQRSSGFVAVGTGNATRTGARTSFGIAEFDALAIAHATPVRCLPAVPGAPVAVQWCGAPNTANAGWWFDSATGLVALVPQSLQLCLTALRTTDGAPSVVTVEVCPVTVHTGDSVCACVCSHIHVGFPMCAVVVLFGLRCVT